MLLLRSNFVYIFAIALALFCWETAAARWFILPGLFYSDEYGLVGSCAFIAENLRADRLETRLEYFGNDEGQASFNLFIPRSTSEWTVNARYQISEKTAYSSITASSQDKLYGDTRYWTDLLIRCDFIREGGLFYGLQGSYQRHDFKGGCQDALIGGFPLSEAETFEEGDEITGSIRVGLERRDNRYNTSRGLYVLWQLDLGVSRSTQTSRTLIRSELDLRRYLPIFSSNSVLALSLKGGVIHHQVPYFSRFKMGGSYSLRGFPLDRYSGNAYYIGRAEFRQIVKSDIPSPMQLFKAFSPDLEEYKFSVGFVLFTDFGDLWRDDLSWWGVRQNVGAGLRAIFPPNVVGSLDIATPVDSDHIAVYLNLRQSF